MLDGIIVQLVANTTQTHVDLARGARLAWDPDSRVLTALRAAADTTAALWATEVSTFETYIRRTGFIADGRQDGSHNGRLFTRWHIHQSIEQLGLFDSQN